jgi:transposase InsO family protein
MALISAAGLFERACRNHGIQIRWRPVGEPHFGGHIERLIGTAMGAVQMLPGSTAADLPGLFTSACRKCGHPRRAAAELDGGLADHLPGLRRHARRLPALYTALPG